MRQIKINLYEIFNKTILEEDFTSVRQSVITGFLSIESGVGETKLKHSFSNPFFTWAEFSRHGKNPSNEVDMEENIKHAIFPS